MRSLCIFLAVASVPTVMAGEPGPQLQLLAPLEGASPREQTPVAFSPDGKVLACADFVIPAVGPEGKSLPQENAHSVGSVKL